jgi:CBS domain-containing protein
MNRALVVIPRQMLVRNAVGLIRRTGVSAAPVVDEHGRYVGMLTPADVFRWVEAGCPETAVGPIRTCPYRVQGRLLNGGEAVICTLADGSCPFQAAQPITGGRHADICARRETEPSPFGTLSCHVTTDAITVRPTVLLLDLVRQMIDARADRIAVLDESDRPVGMVSATDALGAVAKALIDEP